MEQLTHAPSPVATSTAKKYRHLFILVGVVSFFVLLLILPSFLFHKREDEKAETTQPMAEINPASAPTLPKIQPIIATPWQEETLDSEADKLHKLRLSSPMEVSNANHSVQPTLKTNMAFGTAKGDANTQFMHQLSQQVPTAQATKIAHPSHTIAQGTMISAILETRVNSELPGMVRAMVDNHVYAIDGSQLLIPKGSRLIGQYTNAITQGQSRVFIVWQRVIRPDFIDVPLASPGTDVLGTAGMGASNINRHFVEQVGTATLLSMLSAGSRVAGVDENTEENSLSTYRETLADGFSQSAAQQLQTNGNIKPTLILHQGTPISVFVARDIDFSTQWQQ